MPIVTVNDSSTVRSKEVPTGQMFRAKSPRTFFPTAIYMRGIGGNVNLLTGAFYYDGTGDFEVVVFPKDTIVTLQQTD